MTAASHSKVSLHDCQWRSRGLPDLRNETSPHPDDHALAAAAAWPTKSLTDDNEEWTEYVRPRPSIYTARVKE